MLAFVKVYPQFGNLHLFGDEMLLPAMVD